MEGYSFEVVCITEFDFSLVFQKEQCSALGLHIDTSGAGELQRSLWRYFDDDEYSLARMQVLVSLCSKPMQVKLLLF